MRTGAIVCFSFAAFGFIAAVNVLRYHKPDENIVSYAVGAFLVPLVLLVVGLKLWEKANRN